MKHCELCGSQVEIMGKTTKWYRNIEIERSSELLEETVKLKEQLKEAEKVIENISLDDTTKCLDQLVDCDTCIYTDRAFKANCNDNGCKTEYARNYFKNKEEE